MCGDGQSWRGDELDTALIGFVRHETVTIHYPIASTADQQDEFEAAEQFIVPNFSQVHTASRQRGKT